MTDRTGDYANDCAKDYLQVDSSEGRELNPNIPFFQKSFHVLGFRSSRNFFFQFLNVFVQGFCRNALVSIVAEFNEGAFDCDCKPPGALG